MRSVKRIEILTGVQEFSLVEQALESHGVTGYMVLHDVRGKGNRHVDSVDPLTGEPESRLIKTTCPPERIETIVAAIRPILSRYGGECIVYDAECMIIDHRHDARGGVRTQGGA